MSNHDSSFNIPQLKFISNEFINSPLPYIENSNNPFTLPPNQKEEVILSLFLAYHQLGIPSLIPIGGYPNNPKYTKLPLYLANLPKHIREKWASRDENEQLTNSFDWARWQTEATTSADIEAIYQDGLFASPYLTGIAGLGTNLVTLDLDLKTKNFPHITTNYRLNLLQKVLGYLPNNFEWHNLSGSNEGWGLWMLSDNFNISPQFVRKNGGILIQGGGVIEIRQGSTGYTLLPPSLHFSGNTYEWNNENFPQTTIPYIPSACLENLLDDLGVKKNKKRQSTPNLSGKGPQPVRSGRNTTPSPLTGIVYTSIFNWLSNEAYTLAMRDLLNIIERNEGDTTGKQAFKCVNPYHDDTTPSAFIEWKDSNTPVYLCHSCEGQTVKIWDALHINWRQYGRKYSLSKYGGDVSIPNSRHREKLNPADTQQPQKPLFDLTPVQGQPIGHQVEFCNQWVHGAKGIPSITALMKLNVLQAPMGTGKTYAVGKFIEELEALDNESKRVIIILHRTTLNINTRKRLEDMGFTILSHIDIGNLSSYGIHDKLVITIDSLHKLQADDFTLPRYDLVFIDEIEEVIKHATIGTIRDFKSRQAINLCYQLIDQAEFSILASANAGLNTIEFIQNSNISSDDTLWVQNTFKRPDLPDYRLVASEDILLKELEKALQKTGGARVLFCSESKTQIENLAAYFSQPENGEYDILPIHSGVSDNPDTQEKIANLSEELAKRPAFVSPSVVSGFDIQTEDVIVIANYRYGILNSEEILQQLGRARHVSELIFYIPDDNCTPKAFTKAEIVKTELRQYQRNYHVIVGPGGIPDLSTEDYNHLNLWATVKAKENFYGSYRRSATLALLEISGYAGTVESARDLTPTETELKAALSDHNKVLKEDKTEQTKTVAPVDDLTLKRKQYKGIATEADRLGNESYHIRKELGLSTATAENEAGESIALEPLTDESLSIWERLGATGALARYLTAIAERGYNLELDRAELTQKIPIPYLTYNTRTQELIHYLLTLLTGGDYDKLSDGTLLSSDNIIDFKRATQKELTDSKGYLSIPNTMHRQLGVNPCAYHAGKQQRQAINTAPDETAKQDAIGQAERVIGVKIARAFLRAIGLDLVKHRIMINGQQETYYSIVASTTQETAETAQRRAAIDNIPLSSPNGELAQPIQRKEEVA